MNVAMRCTTPFGSKASKAQGVMGGIPFFKALLLWTYSFQESMSGTKQLGEPHFPRTLEEEWVHQAPWYQKGMSHSKWGALLRGDRVRRRHPHPTFSPAHLSVGFQLGWIHLWFGPFLPLLLRVVSSWGPSQALYFLL